MKDIIENIYVYLKDMNDKLLKLDDKIAAIPDLNNFLNMVKDVQSKTYQLIDDSN